MPAVGTGMVEEMASEGVVIMSMLLLLPLLWRVCRVRERSRPSVIIIRMSSRWLHYISWDDALSILGPRQLPKGLTQDDDLLPPALVL